MKADIILKKKEDAVSPVIGVMLMLVVTIVIAAVVAAFAGGLATETEATPVTVLDADVYKDKIVLRSLSGDNLKLEDTNIKILSLDGKALSENKASLGSGYLTPGMAVTDIALKTSLTDKYVEINVIYDGKHIILSKEVLVKA